MKTIDSRKILVVDDSKTELDLMRELLSSHGYNVETAPDGITALRQIEISPPNLILLDVMMPGMNGYEVCRQLKQDEATKKIPIIFVTGNGSAVDEARCFEIGAGDYIAKPINLPVLLARVRTQLALHSQRRSLEGMFRDVIEFAPDAFILAEPDGSIVQVNARAVELFGYDRQELSGMPVAILIPPNSRGLHEASRDVYIKQPSSPVTEAGARCQRRDGSVFMADINISPLTTNRGKLTMAVIHDASPRLLQEIQLRELAAQSEHIREEEKKKIARDVHDELGQVLTALRMDLSFLGMQLGAQDPAWLAKTQSMKGLVDRAIQGVRNVSGSLRPSALDMGLVAAIEWQCGEFFRSTGVPFSFDAEHSAIDLDELRSVVVFRIVQESLTNITRYAKATQVTITLEQRGHDLYLALRDNGQGFRVEEKTKKKTFGLLGMRERAIALGGTVEITSAPGQGTLIELLIPLNNPHAKDFQ